MGEVLDVHEHGTSRAGVLARADQTAAQHFDVRVDQIGILIDRNARRPRPVRNTVNGDVTVWAVDVHYVDLREPDDQMPHSPYRPTADDGDG